MQQNQGRRRRFGGLLVEFVLVALLLVGLCIGVVDMSRAWRTKQVMKAAAREGARVASVHPGLQANDPQVVGVIDEIMLDGGFDYGDYRRGVSFTTLDPGDPITVTILANFEPMFLSIVPGIGRIWPLESQVVMRYESRSKDSCPSVSGCIPPEEPLPPPEPNPGPGPGPNPGPNPKPGPGPNPNPGPNPEPSPPWNPPPDA